MSVASTQKNHKTIITILSIVIPIAVAALFGIKIEGVDLSFLPPIYAGINALTFILLLFSVRAIKKGKRVLHEKLMRFCIFLSCVFLVLYIAYHITSDPTPYGGEGTMKYLYYIILISHIVLSVVVIPFVLFTFSRALLGNYPEHKKLARITYPLWLYVTFTGVIVYLMIAPYYV